MSQHDAARLQALFAAAVELPVALREAMLARECADNPELLAELRGLLEADAQVLGTTAQPIARDLTSLIAPSAPSPSMSGMRVGAFELREELGRGGMGTVNRAERVDGSVTQVVAIKFVRRELLDANTLRRFQLERQLMATLDHPNIARLLDASELADGTPYFVMEYVDGVPITDYCERENLPARERVALLRQVCGAVAEAHRELIVHRDLKPANILISAGGIPKLLDFGIAKPLRALAGAPASAETGTAQRYFSPHYAAPEQLTGAPAGVACDVYALGLLMYELLAGTRPFDFSQLSAGQIERLIKDVPPPAPSVALARRAGGAAGIRPRQLQGDLDGIVLRCLRKATHERYASVEQLEADLGNYLDGRPVQARGGHGWYRTQKFVQRNKTVVAASALVAAALLLGLVAFAEVARVALRRAAELEQVSKFQADMLGQVDPTRAGRLLSADFKAKFEQALIKAGLPEGERTARLASLERDWSEVNATDTARDLIDRTILEPAADAIDKQFEEQPVVAAALRQVLARRYWEMGLYDAALPLQEQALAARRRVLGEEHPDTLTSISDMGELLNDQGKLTEAEPYYREALRKRREVLGEDHPDTIASIGNMGQLLMGQGKLDEVEPYYREALEKRRRVLGEEHPDTLTAVGNMGTLLHQQGNVSAEPFFRVALEKRRRVLGEEHPDTIVSIQQMAAFLRDLGKHGEAEPLFREALEKSRRVLGEEHPNTLGAIADMGAALQDRGQLAESETYFRESLEKRRRVLGVDHPQTISTLNSLGTFLHYRGELEQAEQCYREALAASRRVQGEEHADTAVVDNLGVLLFQQGKLTEAEPYLLEALATRRRVLGAENFSTLVSINNVGLLRTAQGRHTEAAELLAPAEVATRSMFTGDNAFRLARFLTNLGRSRAGLGQFRAAEANVLEAHGILVQTPGPSPRILHKCTEAIVDLYSAWHKAQPGKGYDRKLAEWKRKLDELDAAKPAAAGPIALPTGQP